MIIPSLHQVDISYSISFSCYNTYIQVEMWFGVAPGMDVKHTCV